jgi:hypothetical protein
MSCQECSGPGPFPSFPRVMDGGPGAARHKLIPLRVCSAHPMESTPAWCLTPSTTSRGIFFEAMA